MIYSKKVEERLDVFEEALFQFKISEQSRSYEHLIFKHTLIGRRLGEGLVALLSVDLMRGIKIS